MKRWISALFLCVFVLALCPSALASYEGSERPDDHIMRIKGGTLTFSQFSDGHGRIDIGMLPWVKGESMNRYRVDIREELISSRYFYDVSELEFEFTAEGLEKLKNRYPDDTDEQLKQIINSTVSYLEGNTGIMYTTDPDSGMLENNHVWIDVGVDYMVSNAANAGNTVYFPESDRIHFVLSNGPKLKESSYSAAKNVLYDVTYDKVGGGALTLTFNGGADRELLELKYEDEVLSETRYTVERTDGNLIVTIGEETMMGLKLSKEAGYHKFVAVFHKTDEYNGMARLQLIRTAVAGDERTDLASAVFVNVIDSALVDGETNNPTASEQTAVVTKSLPSTGDKENLMLWAALLALAAAGLHLYARKKNAA